MVATSQNNTQNGTEHAQIGKQICNRRHHGVRLASSRWRHPGAGLLANH